MNQFEPIEESEDAEVKDNQILKSAEAARDAGDFDGAADSYAEYLEKTPGNTEVLLKLGNCCRKARRFEEAEAAYRNAIALRPGDYDIHLNYGRLLRQMGRTDEAITRLQEAYKQALAFSPNDFSVFVNLARGHKWVGDMASAHQAYRKALEINPSCSDAARELDVIAGSASPEVRVTGRTIYLDLTDLIDYVKQENITLSGIQRVVVNLLSETKRYEIVSGSRIALTVYEYDLGKFCEVDRVVVASLVSALKSDGKTSKDIDQVVRAVLATRRPVEPKSGDDFAIPGAFWIYPNYDAIKDMRANGVRFTLFIHDLIQISHPQFVSSNQRFRQALVDALMLADFVVTNSEYVAKDVRKFMSSRLNFSVPVKSALLATALVGDQKQIAQPIRRDVRTAGSSPFVLSVSTIEVRKNHLYIIKLWEELIAKGVKNIPNLVFVGRLGWDIEPLMKYIDQSGHLDGRLHILSNVSDHELTYLYDRCLFTMFPSFVEGFGLPVVESLAHGKPCIASNRSSLPEVGGRFVKYVSPEDVEGGVRLVEELLADPAALPTWEKEIREEYRPRTWTEFTVDFYDGIREQKQTPSCYTNFLCDPGEIYSFGFSTLAERDARKQQLTYCASVVDTSWYSTEDWGVWMAKRRAGMLFRTHHAPSEMAAVYLELSLANETSPSSARFSVLSGGEPVEVCYFDSRRQWFVFEVPVGAMGEVDIELVAMGEFNPVAGGRQVYLGARRLCCCKADDTRARIRVLEKLTFLGN
jgi:glycosyltransferase involved in cell wall biosynthesis